MGRNFLACAIAASALTLAPARAELPAGTASLSDATAKITGQAPGDWSGIRIATGDLNGDGTSDLVIGAKFDVVSGGGAGAAYVLYGPVAGTVSLADADATVTGEAVGDEAGFDVATGDLNGDGVDDLIVGATKEATGGASAGAVYVVNGPVAGTVSLASADAKLTGEAAGDQAGVSVTSADLNGDGVADLVVGAFLEDAGGTDAGAVYVINGPIAGTASLATADAKITGEASDDLAGLAIAAGDLNGGAAAELIVGSPLEDTGGTDAGAIYVVNGPIAGTVSLASADAKRTGDAAGDAAGVSVAIGDISGDGAADLVVGALREDTGGNNAGAVYVVNGPIAGTASLAAADAKLTGEAAGDEVGGSAFGGDTIATGDYNADGIADFVVGTSREDSGGTDAGAAYVVHGPVAGAASLASAAVKLTGEAAGDGAGVSIATGDMTGDGVDDLSVGAYLEDTGGADAGAVYTLYGDRTCGDPDGDGDMHSTLDPKSNEVGLVSSGVHSLDQSITPPVGEDQGLLAELNCAVVARIGL